MNNEVFEISESSQLLKAGDVSRILNISRSMTYRLLDHGEIPCIHINQAVRVHPNDLEAFIKKNRSSSR
ncbi:MAG: Helix-turn-helix domain [Chloroflexota bacterium]|nr:Helix-turn-helix domain [Chloroflexota bacterium]